MKTQSCLVSFFLLITSCAAPLHLRSPAEYREHLAKTRDIPPYLVFGGAWVAERPVYVNQDFDFSMALMDAAMGPALAAAMRQKKSQETAAALAPMADPQVEATLQKSLRDCGASCNLLAESHITLHAILFGDKNARLQTILELAPLSPGKMTRRFVTVSDAFDLQQDWLAHKGQKIVETMQKAIAQLTHMTTLPWDNPNFGQAPNYRCAAGGTSNYAGYGVKESDTLTLYVQPNTVVACSGNALLSIAAPSFSPPLPEPPAAPH